jgi:hypothetical protein
MKVALKIEEFFDLHTRPKKIRAFGISSSSSSSSLSSAS